MSWLARFAFGFGLALLFVVGLECCGVYWGAVQ